MRQVTSLAAGTIVVAVMTAATGTPVFAQGATIDKHTILTFSAPVQMPGVTLPAGKYVFRIANPDSPSVMRVYDAKERHVLGQFYFVRTPDRTTNEHLAADGKPVVVFHETPAGTAPAIRALYYPTDLAGQEFLYPKEQAEKLALSSKHRIVMAEHHDEKGANPLVKFVEREKTEAQAAPAVLAAAPSIPEPIEPQAVAANDDTVTLQSPAEIAAELPPADVAAIAVEPPPTPSIAIASAAQDTVTTKPPRARAASRPTGTSGTQVDRPVGTSGRNEAPAAQAPASSPAAAKPDLPNTSSPLPLVGLAGFLALIGAVGLRLTRATNG